MHLHMLGAGDTLSSLNAPTSNRLPETEDVSNIFETNRPSTKVTKNLVPAGYISAGARGLHILIKWFHRKFGECFPKQKFLAARLHCSIPTVKRWLAELVAAGDVRTIARGRRGSLYIPVDKLAAIVENDPVYDPDLTLPSITTESTTEEKTALQKPPVENKGKNRIELPPRTVTNEYGRTELNPDHVAIVTILRAASSRIASARFPVRYEQAILRREMLRLGLLRETDPEPTLRKPAAFECAWPESRRLKA